MTCLEAQNLLAGWLAGALEEAARSGVQEHLPACAACAASERRLREAWDFLDSLEPPAPPLDLPERLEAAVPASAAAPVPEPGPPARKPPAALVAAAACVAALLAGIWIWQNPFRPAPPPLPKEAPRPEPPRPPPLHWAHPGEGWMSLVSLKGARIWAASGSRGAVDAAEERLVLEEGTVWGRPLAGEKLSLEAAGWRATLLRGTFTASVVGGVVALTCHEGLMRLDSGPAFSGPSVLPGGTSVMLLPGRPPLGPRTALGIYPGEPGEAPEGERWWKGLEQAAPER